ncbi:MULTISPECIES: hypothetical protein [unclassified Sulfitobacter]|uniref:hypothetical protein n=1 Tax=unclassified Sulfitobacter TaxID=196795 RepID=UPI00374599D2
MKFSIAAHAESYGKHRFSNNEILNKLAKEVEVSDDLTFVWWVEKMFLSPKYEEITRQMMEKPWFGVMHVPLLTPNWAMYSQNNLSKMYFMREWRMALKNCRGIITLSDHMRKQVKAIYPELDVFSLKHPMPGTVKRFDLESYINDPKLLLVGAWLRDFSKFVSLDTNIRKHIVINHYARDFIEQRYKKYQPNILKDVLSHDHVGFLDNQDYDDLICSSVLYLSLHETSANNAICECVQYSVPFVARRHPAIEEYAGEEYPLFVEDDTFLDISVDQVIEAHKYLEARNDLKKDLDISSFIDGIRVIYSRMEHN